ncbi:hypothetical protein KBD49_07495 [Myxococcota bacterium]|nr:hypothetical protein [Myxococcota bacterium]
MCRSWLPLWLVLGGLCCGSESWSCKDDYDCDGTDLCQVSTGRCVALSSVECRRDQDCVAPELGCLDLRCVPRCSDESPCPQGNQVCQEGLCVVPGGSGLD